MEKVSLRAPPRVHVRHPHQRRHSMSVTQRLHRSVPYVNRMRYRLIPVRVLVTHSRKDLVQVVHVGVPYVSPEYLVPLVLLEAVLDVVRVEVVVALGGRRAQHQLARDEVLACVLHGVRGVREVRVEGQGRRDSGHEPDGLDPGVQQRLERPETSEGRERRMLANKI